MKKILILCCFLLSSLLCLSQGNSRWEELARNERQYVEVDFASIKRTNESILVWVKTIYIDREYYIDDMVDDLMGTDVSSTFKERATWDKWTHSISYCEFCNETMIPLNIAHYNNDGTVITRIDFSQEKIIAASIPPDTLLSQTYLLLNATFIFDVNGRKYTMNIEDIDMFVELNPAAEYVGWY